MAKPGVTADKDFWVRTSQSSGGTSGPDGPALVEVPYGFTKVLEGLEFQDAVEKIQWALKREGVNVLTSINVRQALLQNAGIDLGRQYVILGVNNPYIAHKALLADPSIGLMLPFNVVVGEGDTEGSVVVQVQKPTALASVVGRAPEVWAMLADAEKKMSRAMDSLTETLRYNAQTKKWHLKWDWRNLEIKAEAA